MIAAATLDARLAAFVSAPIAPTFTPLICRSPAVIAPKVDAAAPVTCATDEEPRFALCALTRLETVHFKGIFCARDLAARPSIVRAVVA